MEYKQIKLNVYPYKTSIGYYDKHSVELIGEHGESLCLKNIDYLYSLITKSIKLHDIFGLCRFPIKISIEVPVASKCELEKLKLDQRISSLKTKIAALEPMQKEMEDLQKELKELEEECNG